MTQLKNIDIKEATPIALDWLMHMLQGNKVEVIQNLDRTCLWPSEGVAADTSENVEKKFQFLDGRPVILSGDEAASFVNSDSLAAKVIDNEMIATYPIYTPGGVTWMAEIGPPKDPNRVWTHGASRNEAAIRVSLLAKLGADVHVPDELLWTKLVLTESEYLKYPSSSRDVWTTERTDWPQWEQMRHRFMGQRTLMREGGLHVEGVTMVILP